MTHPDRPVLLTGASGMLGRQITAGLGALGWPLVLTDIAPFPDALPPGARFTPADLEDGPAILRLAEGCGAILHFGGVSVEKPFETIIGPNIRGVYHIFEAARRERARVCFASSNHAIGFHERTETLDEGCDLRPDGYYGLSKAYAELMGRLYWDKHGVESVHVRIGSSLPEPVNARMLSTYLSFADIVALMRAVVLAPRTGCRVVWGASANSRTFWGKDARDVLGWTPQDSADHWAAQLAGVVSDDPVEERYQGGAYTRMDYTRDHPVPADPKAAG